MSDYGPDGMMTRLELLAEMSREHPGAAIYEKADDRGEKRYRNLMAQAESYFAEHPEADHTRPRMLTREQLLPQAEEARLYAEIALADRQADLAAKRRERAEQSTLGYWRGLLAHQGAPAQEVWIPPARTMGISDGTKTSPTPERVLMMRRAAYAGGAR